MKHYLLQISSVLLFIVSATLNITGYIKLFPNSVWMAGSILAGLELAKFTIVGVVYNMKDGVGNSIKFILSLFLVLLILISVVGHYAMLTSFYTSSNTKSIELVDNTKFIKERMSEVKVNIEELRALYKDFPKGYASKRMKVYTKVKPQIDALQLEYKQLVKQLNSERLETQSEHKEHTNIFKASADLMSVSADSFALFIIMLLSVILDPLALLMVFTSHKVSTYRYNKEIEAVEVLEQQKALSIQEEPNALYKSLTEMRDRSIYRTSVKDIMEMSVADLSEFKSVRLNTKGDRDWFKLALIWREYGSIVNNELVIDFTDVRDININTVYGKY